MAILYLAALAEKCVRLIEEQHYAAGFGRVKNLLQVLFGLADVFADHRRQIDAVEVEVQFAGEHLGGQRFSRSALAGEKRAEAESAAALRREAPSFVNRHPLARLREQLPEHLLLHHRQYQIVPPRGRQNPLGKAVQAGAREQSASVPKPGPDAPAIG